MKTSTAALTTLLCCTATVAQTSKPTSSLITRATSRAEKRTAYDWYRDAWKALEEDSGLYVDGYFELPEEWWDTGEDWTKVDYSRPAFTDPVRHSERALTYVKKAVHAGVLRFPGETLAERASAFSSNLNTLSVVIDLLRVRSIQRLERGVPQTASQDAETLLALATQLDASEHTIAILTAYSLETTVSSWVRHAKDQLDEESVAAWCTRIERRLAGRTTPLDCAWKTAREGLAQLDHPDLSESLGDDLHKQLIERVEREIDALLAPLPAVDFSTLTHPLDEELRERLATPMDALDERTEHTLREVDDVLKRLTTLGPDKTLDERGRKLAESALDQAAVLLTMAIAPNVPGIVEASTKARLDLEKALEALR